MPEVGFKAGEAKVPQEQTIEQMGSALMAIAQDSIL